MVLQKLFGFDPSKHSVKTEIMAGLTSFLTMAYILAVNPNIFSALADQGMDTKAVFTATIIAAVIGTLVMAIYAKLPFGLAPGMGLNAFFVYNVCLQLHYSWQFALTAILLEGIIFIIFCRHRCVHCLIGVKECRAHCCRQSHLYHFGQHHFWFRPTLLHRYHPDRITAHVQNQRCYAHWHTSHHPHWHSIWRNRV